MPLLLLIVAVLLNLTGLSKAIRLKPGKIGHTAKGVQYYVNNSYRGLKAMVRAHKPWADRDVHRTIDGVLVITHWGKPLAHGFSDPHRPAGARVLTRNMSIEQMTWAEVRRLVAPGGYKIHSLRDDMIVCAHLGIRPLYEPKSNVLAHEYIWTPVYAQYRALRKNHPWFRIRGYALGRNAKCIQPMRNAGIPTSRIKRW